MSMTLATAVGDMVGDDPEALRFLAEVCESIAERRRLLDVAAEMIAERNGVSRDLVYADLGKVTRRYYDEATQSLSGA